MDEIKQPKHYMFFGTEAINILKALKYRLRAGKKDDAEKDIKKSLQFEIIYKDFLLERGEK